MSESVAEFYDLLAGEYHLIFEDWRASLIRQGEILDGFIRNRSLSEKSSILDCSCGIGTQAIGLALQGHTVTGTDLSPGAIARARHEARLFGVSIDFAVADFRALHRTVPGTYDVVLSCDNAISHLLTDSDLLLASQNMLAKLRPHGMLLLALRDYDSAINEQPRFMSPQVIDDVTGRRIVFQIWDWHESGRSYTLHHYIVREQHGEWRTTQRTTEYRALSKATLTATLREAGFANIRWHATDETGYVLPIVTADTQAGARGRDEPA